MHQGKGLCEDDDFPNGITNGAKWYIVEGGMQVINIVLYWLKGLEVQCIPGLQLPVLQLFWDNDRAQLLQVSTKERAPDPVELQQGSSPLLHGGGPDWREGDRHWRGGATSAKRQHWGVRDIWEEHHHFLLRGILEAPHTRKLLVGLGHWSETSLFGWHFSIRASSPDESLVSGWEVIRTSSLDSKQHVRLDFQLSSRESNEKSYCELDYRDTDSGAGSVPANRAVFLVLQIISFLSYIYRTWVNYKYN